MKSKGEKITNKMEKNKRNIQIVYIVIGILIGIILSTMFLSISLNEDFEKKINDSYNSGYFYGLHESQFIDCTLPELNKTMEIVYMFNNSN